MIWISTFVLSIILHLAGWSTYLSLPIICFIMPCTITTMVVALTTLAVADALTLSSYSPLLLLLTYVLVLVSIKVDDERRLFKVVALCGAQLLFITATSLDLLADNTYAFVVRHVMALLITIAFIWLSGKGHAKT